MTQQPNTDVARASRGSKASEGSAHWTSASAASSLLKSLRRALVRACSSRCCCCCCCKLSHYIFCWRQASRNRQAMRTNVEIRRAHINDAQALSELAIRTFTETFAQSWRPDALREYVSSSYSVEAIRKSLKDPNTTILLAFPAGDLAPCGFATLLHDKPRPDLSPDVMDTDDSCMELQKFYVDKPFHGKGVAQELMDHVLHEVRVTRCEKSQRRRVVWLRVWENNLRAIQFYRKRGFQVCGDVEIFDGFRDLVLECVVDVRSVE